MNQDTVLQEAVSWYRDKYHVTAPVIPLMQDYQNPDGAWLVVLRCHDPVPTVELAVYEEEGRLRVVEIANEPDGCAICGRPATYDEDGEPLCDLHYQQASRAHGAS